MSGTLPRVRIGFCGRREWGTLLRLVGFRGFGHPGQLVSGFIVVSIDFQEILEPAYGIRVPLTPLGDVRQRVERYHVFLVQLQHFGERSLGGGVVPKVDMAPTENDTGGGVLGLFR